MKYELIQQNSRARGSFSNPEIEKYFKSILKHGCKQFFLLRGRVRVQGLYPNLPRFLLSQACSRCPSLGSLQEQGVIRGQHRIPAWPPLLHSSGSHRERPLALCPALPAPHRAELPGQPCSSPTHTRLQTQNGSPPKMRANQNVRPPE